ncbi:NAD-binding protein [Fomitopsis schrenkii]|uniref:NAD-binding protein n=1 Tax=Fomitopsis schrenkii TaxID=2126942 RepID=S8DPV6_FOMSC|nr:NAD-binding protein [Fomitopsis schrenkii]
MSFFTEIYYILVIFWRVLFPRGNFKAGDVPDLNGRVAIVTGAVYMASRSKDKATEAIGRLKEETGKEAIFLELDLSSLASVRKAAQEFLSKEAELHILFNNAGVMGPPIDQVTADGFDMQFGTNVIGHFLFTELLMLALLAGTHSSPDRHTRVVTTSSSGAMYGKIDFESFREGPGRRRHSKEALYAQSKLANVIVAREVAKRYGDQGIVSISVDPGYIKTELQRYYRQTAGSRLMLKLALLNPPPFGALTQLWAGTAPEAIHENGKYAIPIARIARCRAEAYDDELGRKVWAALGDAVKEQ